MYNAENYLERIRENSILSDAPIERLFSIPIPEPNPSFYNFDYEQIVQYYNLNPADMENEIYILAAKLIDEGNLHDAWQMLI